MGRRRRRFDAMDSFVTPRAKLVKQSLCSCLFLWNAIKTCSLVLFFYFFSISLTFYNQKYFHIFKNPLSITMVHLVVKFLLAGCFRGILTCCTGKKRTTLPWSMYVTRVAPPGFASALDIGLSNWGLEFVTISLYTMTKSTCIIFILGFSILFRLERLRCSLVIVIMFIALGLTMFTFDLTQFSTEGFILVLIASFLSGLRWSLAQKVMQKNEIGLGNPLDMMYHIQPWMMLALLPLSAGIEGVHFVTSKHTFGYTDSSVMIWTVGIIMLGAMLGFMLELSEFLLLSFTSGLTLIIAGVIKELCLLLLAVLVNGDKMSGINAIGLVICVIGIILHIIFKAVQVNEPKPLGVEAETLLQNGSGIPESCDEEEEQEETNIFDVIRDR
ncbi:hypothetical protein NP493_5g14028 [Ridgeia piscesae]|uniref:Sugar phosphate transporter domain-containing protein n=1 Tax=Ridgeia piscesae TaxID=27915 RepID=A0AAD9ULF9_RIDPI|nr:hypothetical protein NP493_5g14028 [Ridgeia piscesae]